MGKFLCGMTACQSAIPHQGPSGPWSLCQRPFNHMNVSLVGLLPFSSGFTLLFTMVDRATMEVAKVFVTSWLAQFGMPLDITLERGPQFTSKVWIEVTEHRGVHISLCSSPKDDL